MLPNLSRLSAKDFPVDVQLPDDIVNQITDPIRYKEVQRFEVTLDDYGRNVFHWNIEFEMDVGWGEEAVMSEATIATAVAGMVLLFSNTWNYVNVNPSTRRRPNPGMMYVTLRDPINNNTTPQMTPRLAYDDIFAVVKPFLISTLRNAGIFNAGDELVQSDVLVHNPYEEAGEMEEGLPETLNSLGMHQYWMRELIHLRPDPDFGLKKVLLSKADV